MAALVELFAAQIGWKIGKYNVVVEGTTDVSVIQHAAQLHRKATGVDAFGDGFAVVAAGFADDGGVEGVNRRLSAARQNADADRDANGALRFRFIGLFDNDYAGNKAIGLACSIDRRVVRYRDVFLLHPRMPLASPFPDPSLEQNTTSLNGAFAGMDWEIEDYLSEDFKARFESQNPAAVKKRVSRGGRTHRDLTREGKRAFHAFIREQAEYRDMTDIIRVIRALRSYLGMRHNHIVIPSSATSIRD